MSKYNYSAWPKTQNPKFEDAPRKRSSETSVEISHASKRMKGSKKQRFVFIHGHCNEDQTASAIGLYYGHRSPLNIGHRLPGLVHSTKRAELLAATEALKRLYNSPDYKNEQIYVFTDNVKLIECLKNVFCAGDLRSEVEQLRRLSCKFSSEVSFEHIYSERKMHGCLKANRLAQLALTGGLIPKERPLKHKAINHPFETLGVPGASFSNKQLVDGRFPDSAPSSPWTTDFSDSLSVSSLMEYVQPVTDKLKEMAESAKKRVQPATDMAWGVAEATKKSVDMAWNAAETAKKSVREIADKNFRPIIDSATQRVQDVNNNQIQPLIKSAKRSVREVRKNRIVPLLQIFASDRKQIGPN